jgi:hypothetical protein
LQGSPLDVPPEAVLPPPAPETVLRAPPAAEVVEEDELALVSLVPVLTEAVVVALVLPVSSGEVVAAEPVASLLALVPAELVVPPEVCSLPESHPKESTQRETPSPVVRIARSMTRKRSTSNARWAGSTPTSADLSHPAAHSSRPTCSS